MVSHTVTMVTGVVQHLKFIRVRTRLISTINVRFVVATPRVPPVAMVTWTGGTVGMNTIGRIRWQLVSVNFTVFVEVVDHAVVVGVTGERSERFKAEVRSSDRCCSRSGRCIGGVEVGNVHMCFLHARRWRDVRLLTRRTVARRVRLNSTSICNSNNN